MTRRRCVRRGFEAPWAIGSSQGHGPIVSCLAGTVERTRKARARFLSWAPREGAIMDMASRTACCRAVGAIACFWPPIGKPLGVARSMSITITEKAAKEIQRVLTEQKMSEATVLRIGVAGG